MNDKLQHAIAGFAGALFASLLYALIALSALAGGTEFPAVSIVPVPAVAALTVGVTKEVADWLDNRLIPGLHEVDPYDVIATTAPGVALSLLLAAILATTH